MKLWEVLKALEENPNKKFECVNMRLERVLDIYRFTNVNTQERAFYMGVDNDWQEVKQPIPWEKAIEEWAKGENISCEVDGCVFFYSKDSKFGEDKWRVLKSREGEPISVNEILNGKWYVEED